MIMTQHPKRPLIILFSLALLSLIYITTVAPRFGFAVLYAPQTDSLQPIPDSVGPNLSENIQSQTGEPLEQSASEEPSVLPDKTVQQSEQTETEAGQGEQVEKESDGQLFFWLTAILVICLVALSWWTYRSTGKEKKLE